MHLAVYIMSMITIYKMYNTIFSGSWILFLFTLCSVLQYYFCDCLNNMNDIMEHLQQNFLGWCIHVIMANLHALDKKWFDMDKVCCLNNFAPSVLSQNFNHAWTGWIGTCSLSTSMTFFFYRH